MNYGISREEEAKLPKFNSHAEARMYFKDKYGADFMITNSEVIDGEKIYFYKLILDREAYCDMMAHLEVNGYVPANEKYLFSSQDIQIHENGFVHIIH